MSGLQQLEGSVLLWASHAWQWGVQVLPGYLLPELLENIPVSTTESSHQVS